MTERVTVTSPRKRAGRAPRHRPCGGWAGPAAGPIRVLVREQARLALGTCAIVALVIGGLPVLFACEPGLSRVRVLGVRLPWLILCVGVPVVWVATARRHVRLAERAERDFAARDLPIRGRAEGHVPAPEFPARGLGELDLPARGSGGQGLGKARGSGERGLRVRGFSAYGLPAHRRTLHGSAPPDSAARSSAEVDVAARDLAEAARPE